MPTYVGDNPERLTATLQRAFARQTLFFPVEASVSTSMTTHQCAAKALGRELVLHVHGCSPDSPADAGRG